MKGQKRIGRVEEKAGRLLWGWELALFSRSVTGGFEGAGFGSHGKDLILLAIGVRMLARAI